MSEEYSNGYARGYEAGQQSVLKLAEQPAQLQQEPDAFVTSLTAGPDGVARSGLDRVLPLMAGVYLTPQPAQRKPLTDEMDKRAAHIEYYSRRDWFITGWLQAEAAHGIKP